MKRTSALLVALAAVGTAGTALASRTAFASQHGYRSELSNVQNLASTVAHKAQQVSARVRQVGWQRGGFRQDPVRASMRGLRMAALTLASRTFRATPAVLSSDLAVVRARFREARNALANVAVSPWLRSEFESIRGDLRAIKASIERMRAFQMRHVFVPASPLAPVVPRVTYAPPPVPAPTAVYRTNGVNVSWYQAR